MEVYYEGLRRPNNFYLEIQGLILRLFKVHESPVMKS